MADLDRSAGLSAAAADGMAARVEKLFSEAVHFGQGHAVEQKKFGGGAEIDHAERKRKISAVAVYRRTTAI